MARLDIEIFQHLRNIGKVKQEAEKTFQEIGDEASKVGDKFLEGFEKRNPQVRRAMLNVVDSTKQITVAEKEYEKALKKRIETQERARLAEKRINDEKDRLRKNSVVQSNLERNITKEAQRHAKALEDVRKKEAQIEDLRRMHIKTNAELAKHQLVLDRLQINRQKAKQEKKPTADLTNSILAAKDQRQPWKSQSAMEISTLATHQRDLDKLKAEANERERILNELQDKQDKFAKDTVASNKTIEDSEKELQKATKEGAALNEEAARRHDRITDATRKRDEASRRLLETEKASADHERKSGRGSGHSGGGPLYRTGQIFSDIPGVPGGQAGAYIGSVVILGLASVAEAAVTASQAVALLPAVATAAAAGFGTLALATNGFGNAIKNMGDPKKFAEALAGLSPNAQQAALEIKSLVDGPLGDLQNKAQDTFFAGIPQKLHGLTDQFLPEINNLTTSVSGAFNKMFQIGTDQLLSPSGQKSIDSIINNIVTAFNNLAPSIGPIVDAFTKITETGSSFLPGLAKSFADTMTTFADFIAKAQQDGSLQNFIQKGIDAAKALGNTLFDIGKKIYDIFGNKSPDEFKRNLDAIVNTAAEVAQAIVGIAHVINDLINTAGKFSDAVGGWQVALTTAIGGFTAFKLAGALAATETATKFSAAGTTAGTGFATKAAAGLKGFGWAAIGTLIASEILKPMGEGVDKWLRSRGINPTGIENALNKSVPGFSILGLGSSDGPYGNPFADAPPSDSTTPGVRPSLPGAQTNSFGGQHGSPGLSDLLGAPPPGTPPAPPAQSPYPAGSPVDDYWRLSKGLPLANANIGPYADHPVPAVPGDPISDSDQKKAIENSINMNDPSLDINNIIGSVGNGMPIGSGPMAVPVGPGSSQTSGYEGLQPGAKSLEAAVRQMFPMLGEIGGWRADGQGSSDHPSGNALDIMIPGWDTPQGKQLGDMINQWLQQNAGALGVDSTIWQDQMMFASGQSGGQVPGHMNHIHARTTGAPNANHQPPLMYGTNGKPYDQPGYGYMDVDPNAIANAQQDVVKQAQAVRDARIAEKIAEKERAQNLISEWDLQKAKDKARNEEAELEQKKQKLFEAQQGKWKDVKSPGAGGGKGSSPFGNVIDNDFGISGGLPGIVDNALRLVGNLFMAPVLTALNGIAGMNPNGGSGLIGMAAAQGAFGPQFMGQPQLGGQQFPYGPGGMPNNPAGSMLPVQGFGTPNSPQAIANMIYQQAISRGYSPQEAQSIVAYAIGESGLNPGISGGIQGGDEVIGLFQQKADFARQGGIDPSQRADPVANTYAYLNQLERNRNLPIEQALPATSVGGPLAQGPGAQPQSWGPLMDQAAQYIAGGGGGGAPGGAPLLPGMYPQGGYGTTGGMGMSPLLTPPASPAAGPGGGGYIPGTNAVTRGAGAGIPGMGATTSGAGYGPGRAPGEGGWQPSGGGFGGFGGGATGMATSAMAAGLDAMAPGSGQAAQAAMAAIQRTIGFMGQAGAIGVQGIMETFGLSDSVLGDPQKSWIGRIAAGFAGARPSLPNAAGQPQVPLQQQPQDPNQQKDGKGGPALHIENFVQAPNRNGMQTANDLAFKGLGAQMKRT